MNVAQALLPVLVFGFVAGSQDFTQRGFLETNLTLFPQTARNDAGHAILESDLQYLAAYKLRPWLRFQTSLDARIDTHRQIERTAHLDWQDRSLQRPALSLRELTATISKGRFTAELGKQFVRWGKADILNPTDRFAPKDFLSVTDPGFLSITAARITYDTGSNAFDLIWQPRFTPSRTPLLNQRWTVVPEAAAQLPISVLDHGSRFPGRSSFGGRWNHTASGYEYSFSYYDGFSYLPVFDTALLPRTNDIQAAIQRSYPRLRLYGADLAAPFRWLTLKTEAAYYTSPDSRQQEYMIYVVQLERQMKELLIVLGYAGDAATSSGQSLQFSPERGFARAVLSHAQYAIDANRNVSLDAVIRQNGKGSLLRAEYSQTFGQHWRATAGFALLRGDSGDFLGQYHRNSHAILSVRYSF